jgi:hypothetical protein
MWGFRILQEGSASSVWRHVLRMVKCRRLRWAGHWTKGGGGRITLSWIVVRGTVRMGGKCFHRRRWTPELCFYSLRYASKYCILIKCTAHCRSFRTKSAVSYVVYSSQCPFVTLCISATNNVSGTCKCSGCVSKKNSVEVLTLLLRAWFRNQASFLSYCAVQFQSYSGQTTNRGTIKLVPLLAHGKTHSGKTID